jgi:predicted phage-related endonuclease
MSEPMQNYTNHGRYRPLFHFSTLPILWINAIVFIVVAVRAPSLMSAWMAVVFASIAVWALDNRNATIAVQDRVIRDEMRLRLEQVLGSGAKETISSLTAEHMIGLRFASDRELPSLVERVKKGELADRKAIKKEVKEWQADHLRA